MKPFQPMVSLKPSQFIFYLELVNRGNNFGVRSYSVHPGIIVETELNRHVSNETLQNFGAFDENDNIINNPSKGLKSLSQGASTTVWCAPNPKLNNISGVYCEDVEIAELDNLHENKDGIMKNVMPYALDEATAKKPWKVSKELIDIKFNI